MTLSKLEGLISPSNEVIDDNATIFIIGYYDKPPEKSGIDVCIEIWLNRTRRAKTKAVDLTCIPFTSVAFASKKLRGTENCATISQVSKNTQSIVNFSKYCTRVPVRHHITQTNNKTVRVDSLDIAYIQNFNYKACCYFIADFKYYKNSKVREILSIPC